MVDFNYGNKSMAFIVLLKEMEVGHKAKNASWTHQLRLSKTGNSYQQQRTTHTVDNDWRWLMQDKL